MAQAAVENRILLVPGFLGFDNLGDFDYFERVVREELQQHLPGLAVEALQTDPAGSLIYRQELLLAQLKQRVSEHPHARFHLVGHSTGGLDAELLIRTPRLTGAAWAPEDLSARRAIRSIITIASPLAGTTLAQSSIADLAAIDPTRPKTVFAALKTNLSFAALWLPGKILGAVALLPFVDNAARNLVSSAVHNPSMFGTFALRLLLRRSLIENLRPQNVSRALRATQPDRELQPQRSRVLTVAQRAPRPSSAGALFAELYDATAQSAGEDPALDNVARSIEAALDNNAALLIASDPGAVPRPFTVQSSDGIVNTLRQLLKPEGAPLQDELNRIVAVAVADHIDVIGYFPGRDNRQNGFLNSGSNFRVDQLRALYRAVATQIQAAAVAPPPMSSVTAGAG